MRRATLISVFGVVACSLLLSSFINSYESEREKYSGATSVSCEVIANNYTKYVCTDLSGENPRQCFTGVVFWKASAANQSYYLNEIWSNNFIPDIGMTRTCWYYAGKVRFYNPHVHMDKSLMGLNVLICTMIFMIFVLSINIGFGVAEKWTKRD